MAKKTKKTAGVVLATAMTDAQVAYIQDLRRGSRSSSHVTARERAMSRTTKAGKAWRREIW